VQGPDLGAPTSLSTSRISLNDAPAGGCLGQARRTIAGAEATDPDAFFGNPQLVTDIRMNSYTCTRAEPSPPETRTPPA
jgi:hypothetical protein